MNIINATTAQRIKKATNITMGFIETFMNDPEEFVLHGYWDVSDVFNPKTQQHIDNLTESEVAALRNWIVSWLSTYDWVLEENNHITPRNFD